MGYFANGEEGDRYQERYCRNCKLYSYGACPCLQAHALWNYDECNKEDSILHRIILRDGTENKECIFFEASDDKESELKPEECEHDYRHIETIYGQRNEGHYNILFIRIDRYACRRCLEDREKEKSESARTAPDWWIGGKTFRR